MSSVKEIKPDTVIEKSRQEYREFFGVVDNFLIQMEMCDDNKTGWIVYIDQEDDINWNDTRVGFFNNEEELKKNQCIARLNLASLEPCTNISKDDLMTFRYKLAVGFVLALVKSFDGVDGVIKESLDFLKARNREVSRKIFLKTSTILLIFSLIIGLLNYDFLKWHIVLASSFVMGISGAYVSIWSNFGDRKLSGLSSKVLHILEVLCRMLVGGLFAIVVYLLLKCNMIIPHIDVNVELWCFLVISFVSGFSERFVPTLIEKVVDTGDDKI